MPYEHGKDSVHMTFTITSGTQNIPFMSVVCAVTCRRVFMHMPFHALPVCLEGLRQ